MRISGMRQLALLILLLPSTSWAGCLEDRRPVSFDREIVQFRRYNCDVGESKLAVEFHRLGSVTATTLLANEASKRTREVIGAPRIIVNDVSSVFTSLVQQYGRAVDQDYTIFSFEAEASGAGGMVKSVPDVGEWRNARITYSDGSYPPLEEEASIRSKIIPNSMQFFYTNFCKDAAGARKTSDSICRNIDASAPTMLFWRSMQHRDVAAFRQRLQAYNSKNTNDPGSDRYLQVPPALQLMSQLAGTHWPTEFAILYGTPTTDDGCEDGRFFSYATPVLMLDVAVIENRSDFPISIDGIIGGRSTQNSLRPASTSNSLAAGAGLIGEPAGSLSMNEKLLIPLRIYLAPNETLETAFPYRKSATELYQTIGTNGYTGNTGAFGAPNSKAYVYGPEIAIGGLLINGTPLKLAKRSANFMEITMSSETGSCPYLVSWDGTRNDWIEHGKILDRAPRKSEAYTEIKTFDGFRGRFRIEEREPELATIQRAALTIMLTDGTILSLEPVISGAGERNENVTTIPWGHFVEVNFYLPKEIRPSNVARSILALTGYYTRYASITRVETR